MSITTEIQRLRTNVNNIRQNTSDILDAIANKGVAIPAGSTLDDCAGLISQIDGSEGTIHRYSKVVMYGKEYRTIEINGIIWFADNFVAKLSGISDGPSGTPSTPALWEYNGTVLYNAYATELIDNDLTTNYSEWRVSTDDDWYNLITFSAGVSFTGLINKTRTYGGIDAFGLSLELLGYRGVSGTFGTDEADFRIKDESNNLYDQGVFFDSNNDIDSPQFWNPISAGSIRLCKNA